jgi:2-polyprenyl-6-hydroxyphenyl methylase / 3-demethylubiquinone-9 3-methyltransferase
MFDALAKHWWDPNGPTKPLHAINPARLAWIGQRVMLKNKTILDVGCGGGLLSEGLCMAGAYVTGIDPSEALIASAKQHAKAHKLPIMYHVGCADNLSNDHLYDVVICLEVLEHVTHPDHVLQSLAHCVKSNGHVIVSTLNQTLYAYGTAVLLGEYILRQLPIGTHQLEKFIPPVTLATMAKAVHLQPMAITGLWYNPLTKQARTTSFLGSHYIAHFQKLD